MNPLPPRGLHTWRRLGGAVVVVLTLFGASALLDHRAAPAGPPMRQGPSIRQGPAQTFDGGTNDSILVYGPVTITADDPSYWTVYDDGFSATAIAGRRYIVEVVNHQNGLTGLMVNVNSGQFVGSSEGGTSLKRIVEGIESSNTVLIQAKGSAGSTCVVRIVHVPDSTYALYGYTQFTKPSPAAVQKDSFPGDSVNAASPYLLRIINGNQVGQYRVSNATVKLNNVTVASGADFGTGVATITKGVTLLGSLNRFEVNNQGANGSYMKVQFRGRDITAPVVTVTAPAADTTYTKLSSITFSGSVADQTPGTVTVNGTGATATPGNFSTSANLPTDGWYTIPVSAINSAGLSSTLTKVVCRDTLAPYLRIDEPTVAATTVTTESLLVVGSWRDTSRTAITVDGDTIGYSKGDTIRRKIALDIGPNGVSFRAVDRLGHKTEFKRFVFRQAANEPTARDSTNQAIGLDSLSQTAGTTFPSSVRFLYVGSNPVQVGVDTTKFDPARVSVLRGQVTSRDFGGLANVTVRVLGHSEYGTTETRKDGRFDLVVNGGAQLTLRFSKTDYLEAQRTVTPGWNQYVPVDSVALIGKTVHRTVVNLDNPSMVRSRFKTDANGDRDIRLLFKAGTRAKVVRAPGDTVSLSSAQYVRVRASEYTVGTNGASSMPAPLPRGSAYTYCVDLSLDEADSLRLPNQPDPEVIFTDSVRCYVRNFLGFPVGTAVPVGYYNRHIRRWVATPDAVVIRILSTSGGSATIDSNGDGQADGQSRLDSLAITATERSALAQEYRVGDELWRSLTTHFSPLDDNVNLALIAAQQSATAGRAGQPQGILPDPSPCQGCIVEAENRVLGERIPIVGTPYSLNYRSYRAPGDKAIRTLRLPVSGDTVPADVQRIVVQLDVAGQRLTQEFTGSLTNKVAVIPWDGKDAYGRTILGSVEAEVSVGYQYVVKYVAGSGGRSLGDQGSSSAPLGSAPGDRSVGNIVWTRRRVTLGAPTAASAGLGGWTISPHHFYDINGRGALYYGDGRVAPNERNVPIITTVAWLPGYPENESAQDVAYAPDGSLYIAGGWSIHRYKDGQLTRVAGKTAVGDYTDGVLGTDTYLRNPRQLTVAPDGTVYFIMDSELSCNCQRVVQIDSAGYVRSVAGDGQRHLPPVGDGSLATSAGFAVPTSIAIGPDGSIFVGDREEYTVRRIAPSGYITRYAGTGAAGSSDSSGKATTIRLSGVNALSVDAQGNLYIAEWSEKRVRKVAPDGMMTVVRHFDYIWAAANDMAVGPDGAVYIATGSGNDQMVGRVWRIDPDGSESVVGGGAKYSPYTDDGIPALGSDIGWRKGMDIAPDGTIYLAGGNVRKIAPPIMASSAGEYSVPSADASEVYVFDLRGRHLRTRDAITGAELFRFAYDGNGQLSKIYDLVGDSTVISRSGNTTITAPFGQQTTLTLSNGYLASVRNPANKTTTLDAGTDGLLRHYTDANNHTHDYTYDSEGRLQQVDGPAGDRQAFQVAYSTGGLTRTVQRQTREGRTRSLAVTDLFDGTRQRRMTDAAGLLTYASDSADAKLRLWRPPGASQEDSLGREPRFGMLAPMTRASRLTHPSGASRVLEAAREYSVDYNPPSSGGTHSRTFTLNSGTAASATYNTATRAAIFTTPEGRITRLMLDNLGRPVSIVVAGLDSIVIAYDSHGRQSLIQQGGRAVRWGYDPSGRNSEIRDTTGRMLRIQYNDANRPTSLNTPGGRSLAYGYDDAGRVTSVTPPGKPSHQLVYTPGGQLSEYLPPASGLTDYRFRHRRNYDLQLYRVERPDSDNVRLDYNATTARLDSIWTGRGKYRYYYGTGGVIDSIASPDTVTVAYQYDGGHVTQETWSGLVGGSVSVELNREFRPKSQSVNGGNTVAFQYDGDGLLTGAGSLSLVRRTDNGIVRSTSLGSVTTTESQNSHGEPWTVLAEFGSTDLLQLVLGRDSLGRIVTLTEVDSGITTTRSYTYSDSGFLTSSTTNGSTVRCAYDGNGNRVRVDGPGADTATVTYDDQDRLLRYKDTSFTYDAAGDLTKRRSGSDSTTYAYDAFGNLVTVILPSGTQLDYAYDGRNRRVIRKVNGAVSHRWLYQNEAEPVAELDSAGGVASRFVYGTRGNVPEYMIRNGVVYRLIADHLGSVRLVVNTTTGVVVQRREYDAWGRITFDSNSGFQPFGYCGGIEDNATGLVRLGVRDYDPSIGRWTTRDPILWFGDEINGYLYADGDPINRTDVSGMKAKPTGKPPSDLGEELIKNICESLRRRGDPWSWWKWFLGSVNRNGPMDYRSNYGGEYEQFGNFNFGAVAAAGGIGLQVAQRGAGFFQFIDGESQPGLLTPVFGPGGLGYPGGPTYLPILPPYGDQWPDYAAIEEGYEFYETNANLIDCDCPTRKR